jgi:hypothetical protein
VPTWSLCLGGDGDETPTSPVLEPDGTVLVGWYSTSLSPGAAGPVLGATTIGVSRVSEAGATDLLTAEAVSTGVSPPRHPPTVGLSPAPRGGVFLYVGTLDEPGQRPDEYEVDLGAGPHRTPYVVQLASDGTFVRDLCTSSGCDVFVLAASDDALVVWTFQRDGSSTVERVDDSGRRVLLSALAADRTTTGGPAEDGCHRAAIAPDGDVVCAGSAPGVVLWGPTPKPGPNPALTRVAPDGTRRWTHRIAGLQGGYGGVALTATGEIVAVGGGCGRAEIVGLLVSCDLSSPYPAVGAFRIRLDPGGTPLWAGHAVGDVVRDMTLAGNGKAASKSYSEASGAVAFELWRASDGATLGTWRGAETAHLQVMGLSILDDALVATVAYRDPAAPPPSGTLPYRAGDLAVLRFAVP